MEDLHLFTSPKHNMYPKLFKNFVLNNKNLFILILISLSLSLSWYIFSDSLTKNFITSIESDAQENLGWDFVIDIGNSTQDVFNNFYDVFPYKDEVELTKEFSILSSVEQNENIVSSNIIFHSDIYPFYSDIWKVITNPNWEAFVSKDFYDSLKKKKLIVLGSEFEIGWYYSNQIWWAFSNFLWTQNILINIENFEKIQSNDTNTLIEKNYYLKLKDESNFDKINSYLESKQDRESWLRMRNYKDWWDRFNDIVSNLRSYINYAVLFSFLLTSTIIFIAISSFFINERKSISILKILWLQNSKLINFIMILFILILIFSLLFWLLLNSIIFNIIQNIEITSWFYLHNESAIQAWVIWWIIIVWATIFPLIKFISQNTNAWLWEDFYWIFSKKEALISWVTFVILWLILSIFLWYSIMKSLISIWSIIIFLIIFYIIVTIIIKFLQKLTRSFREKHFQIYDAIRVANKPGNMTFLISISFFIIFSIGFSLLILFGNFNNRLQVNLQTDKNFFVLNITQDAYEQFSDEYKNDSFSLIKWRILEINNKTLSEHIWWRVSRQYSREFNITDNSLSDFAIIEWNKEVVENTVSLDYDFSQELWIWVWDEILMSIFWIEKKLTVINIRESRDRSINPFFYFQVNSEEFKKYPKQYFLSSYVESKNTEITKKYFYDITSWTATFVEVDKILEELKEISTKVLLVIQSLFLYIIIFCILSIVVVILFFSWQQKKSNYLYTLLWSSNFKNRIKNFSTYAITATLMLVLSILIISPLFYYILSLNTFINFSWSVYYSSLAIIFTSYIVLLTWLWFGNRK